MDKFPLLRFELLYPLAACIPVQEVGNKVHAVRGCAPDRHAATAGLESPPAVAKAQISALRLERYPYRIRH
jgi:hypothetical protein